MPDDRELSKKSHFPWLITILICLAFVLAVVLIFFRMEARKELRTATNAEAIQTVATIITKPGPATEDIMLPATVQAWHEANIFARTNGYIKNWYVDIGSRVKEGDLLAEIEAPEVDAQLHQAEADLNTASANEDLALITAKRWVNLLKSDSVSKQETDEKVLGEKATSALFLAAQANRDKLREIVSYQKVLAPFDGTISLRSIDIGSLINAGSGTNGSPLFHIVQSNPLRVYVQIPQTYVGNIKPEMKVTLSFAEFPGKSFLAKLYQTADAINVDGRTLLAQFWVDNPRGELLPGGYTEMHFSMPLSPKLIRLPVNTLLFRSENLQVAVVEKNNRVSLRRITVSRDFGNEVEVNTGVNAGETIVINPPDSIFNGQQVRVAPESNQALKEPDSK